MGMDRGNPNNAEWAISWRLQATRLDSGLWTMDPHSWCLNQAFQYPNLGRPNKAQCATVTTTPDSHDGTGYLLETATISALPPAKGANASIVRCGGTSSGSAP